ncbi:hypothetical protein [Donghicola sp. XS_ASV15]|uniref:hypothetical protein n=1 Tax=Donghicola sp. XS_ASV15 TaxID=3241295 RepID=UPI0035192DC7
MELRKPSYITPLLFTPLFGLIGWGLALWQGFRGDYALAASAYFAFASYLLLFQHSALTIDLPKGFSLQRVVYGAQQGIWFAAVTVFFDILDDSQPVRLTVGWLIAFSVFGTFSALFARPTDPAVASEFEAPDENARSKFQRIWVMAYPVLGPAFCMLMLSTQNTPLLTAILIAVPIGWATVMKRKDPERHSGEWYAKNLGMPMMMGLMVWVIFRVDL